MTHNTRRRMALLYAASAVLAVSAAAAALCFGSVPITPTALFGSADSVQFRIFALVRIPRMLASLCAGGALAAAGVIIQNVLHNPLAGPGIIGVNSGALFMTVLCAAVLPQLSMLLPLAAFAGALAAMLLVYAAAQRSGASAYTIVLAGIAVSAFISAGTDTIAVLYPDTLAGGLSFRTGSLSGITMRALVPAALLIAAAIAAALMLHNQLDILSLGDETAQSLGLSVRLMRFVFLFLASLLAGSAVSFAGLMGFVGLIIPHAVRMLAGHQSLHVLSLSVLWGAAFVAICDTAARTLFAPHEIPVGIILAFTGGPFFIYLLFKRRGHAPHD
ncbi:MAG TPA: iron ABC transporter permease [Candidatus Treponema faecavium]|nr:iron ABC transporter permease [Candidatus Treponema faecavium]